MRVSRLLMEPTIPARFRERNLAILGFARTGYAYPSQHCFWYVSLLPAPELHPNSLDIPVFQAECLGDRIAGGDVRVGGTVACWLVSFGFELLDGVNHGMVPPPVFARSARPPFGRLPFPGCHVDRPIDQLAGELSTPMQLFGDQLDGIPRHPIPGRIPNQRRKHLLSSVRGGCAVALRVRQGLLTVLLGDPHSFLESLFIHGCAPPSRCRRPDRRPTGPSAGAACRTGPIARTPALPRSRRDAQGTAP